MSDLTHKKSEKDKASSSKISDAVSSLQQDKQLIPQTTQLKLIENINNSPQILQLQYYQNAADENIEATPEKVLQKKADTHSYQDPLQRDLKNKLKNKLFPKGIESDSKLFESEEINKEEVKNTSEEKTTEEEEDEEEAEISVGDFSYSNGKFTIPIWGNQSLEISKEGGTLSGELDKKEIEVSLPVLPNLSIDIPFMPGVYATAGLSIEPTMIFTISGGNYTISAGKTNSVEISDASVSGTMGLVIDATLGAGVGVANIVGVDGGLFGSLSAETTLSGGLNGIANFSNKEINMSLNLNSIAEIIGQAGAYVEVKLLKFHAKKKFNLAEKSFAQFAYSREINLMEAGEETWKPHINNFTKKAYGNRKTVEKFKKDELIYEPL